MSEYLSRDDIIAHIKKVNDDYETILLDPDLITKAEEIIFNNSVIFHENLSEYNQESYNTIIHTTYISAIYYLANSMFIQYKRSTNKLLPINIELCYLLINNLQLYKLFKANPESALEILYLLDEKNKIKIERLHDITARTSYIFEDPTYPNQLRIHSYGCREILKNPANPFHKLYNHPSYGNNAVPYFYDIIRSSDYEEALNGTRQKDSYRYSKYHYKRDTSEYGVKSMFNTCIIPYKGVFIQKFTDRIYSEYLAEIQATNSAYSEFKNLKIKEESTVSKIVKTIKKKVTKQIAAPTVEPIQEVVDEDLKRALELSLVEY
jgi:hypothetical protein